VGGYPLSCPLGSVVAAQAPTRRLDQGSHGSLPSDLLSRRCSATERNEGGRGSQPLSRAFSIGAGHASEGSLRREVRRERRGMSLGGKLRPARDTAGRRSAIRRAWCRSDVGTPADYLAARSSTGTTGRSSHGAARPWEPGPRRRGHRLVKAAAQSRSSSASRAPSSPVAPGAGRRCGSQWLSFPHGAELHLDSRGPREPGPAVTGPRRRETCGPSRNRVDSQPVRGAARTVVALPRPQSTPRRPLKGLS